MYDFRNRTVLLTGAAGGIGRATAELFALYGANAVLADRSLADLEDVAAAIGQTDGGIELLAYDAADSSSAAAAAKLCADRFGGIDFVVSSAGVYFDEPAATMTVEQWRRTLAVNLDGIFYLCNAAMPVLREGSSIVNVASMAGHTGGSFGHSHYGASKGGVIAYSRSLARELGPKTRVNAVSPGIIETPMTASLIGSRGDAVVSQTPLRRYGKPAEVASVIAFLCSDAASFINGEAIHVNGGFYIGG